MNNYLLVILLFFFCACNNTNKEEVLTLDDIVEQAEADKNTAETQEIEVEKYTPSIDIKRVQENGIQWDSVSENKELTIIERFQPVKTTKFHYYIDGKTVSYARWSFTDSTKSMRAYLNWMNCFGNRCNVVDLRENRNIQRNGFIILQADTCIIQLETAGATMKELNKWKKMYYELEDAKFNYVMIQPIGGKSTWYSYIDSEEKTLIPINKQ